MTFDDLYFHFATWGFFVDKHNREEMRRYLLKMLQRDRVIFIYNEEELEAIIFYFIHQPSSTFYKKGMWEVPEDDSSGTQIFIDKMVCRKYTKELRNAIKSAIEERYPMVDTGYYLRAPKDRLVTIYSRRRNELQNQVC